MRNMLATLDCLICFANNALQYNYRKPHLHEGTEMQLKQGRHPVIESNLPPGETYIANDIVLDPTDQQIIILTGPNMSGKSRIAAANGLDYPDGAYRQLCARRRSADTPDR